MEPSGADPWFSSLVRINEMSYFSFLEDFEPLDELVESPIIADVSHMISPHENCSLDSTSDPIPSPEILNATPPPTKMNKRTNKPRNSCSKKEKKDGNERKSGNSNGTKKLASSNSNSKRRKRGNEAIITDVNAEKNPNSRSEVVNRQGLLTDHVLAERKRREKLTQRFITLSSLLPNLTRMDKGTILEDAIKYINQLQGRVKALDAQEAQRVFQATVITQNTESFPDECNSYTRNGNAFDNEFATETAADLPEIDIRFSEQTVLVKIIHCKNHKGIVAKTFTAIESFGLIITCASVVPFAKQSCDVTITAKVNNKDLYVAPEDLIKRLNHALKQL